MIQRHKFLIRQKADGGFSAIRFLLYLSVPAFAAIITFTTLHWLFWAPLDPTNNSSESIEIARDSTLKTVSKELQDRGIIRFDWALRYAGRVSGKDLKIVAGEYEVRRSMSTTDVLSAISSGKPIQRKVVVREGVSIREIGQIVEEAGLISKIDFNQSLSDRALIRNSGSNNGQLEGYLFPETYLFSRPVTSREIITKMLKVALEHWSQSYSDRAEQLGMSRHQIITLASIIEKESGDYSEQPTISSVFHNRLKLGMPLQSDPTVIYGLGEQFDGNITRAHLQTPTPYNTYTITGLPPGPICNPGDTAIKAALYPEDTSYLYFVADGKGRHVFSSTLEDHNQAVAQYQLGLSSQQNGEVEEQSNASLTSTTSQASSEEMVPAPIGIETQDNGLPQAAEILSPPSSQITDERAIEQR